MTSIERWLLGNGYAHDDEIQNKQSADAAEVTCDSNLAQSHLQFGETAAALDLLEACHRRRPEIPRFAMAVAHCQARLGQLDKAHDFLKRAIELGTPSWVGDRLRGQLLAAENQLEKSLEHLLMSEATRPQQRGINSEIGAVYARLGRRDEARCAFNKELVIDANEATALRELGKLSVEDGDYNQALEYLLASAALREVCPETHYLLAKTLRSLGRPADALHAVERALRQAPCFVEARELRLLLTDKSLARDGK